MKQLILSGSYIYTGENSLEALKDLEYKKIMLITGGRSMEKNGWIKKIQTIFQEKKSEVLYYPGIGMNPSIEEVTKGVAAADEFKPDCIVAIGGGSAMDAAKGILLFYEFPWLTFENVLGHIGKGEIPKSRKTYLVCIPSTSGTGSEVTRGTVITDLKKQLKVPIMTHCLRPDMAILDPLLTMSMPSHIVAETGIDALTHGVEAYLNHNLDDISESICLGAIKGLIEWLPVSYEAGSLESREKVHNFQAMAGIGFANTGLGMVHGIAHAYGAVFNLAHGLANAIVLPYALRFNQSNDKVKEKLKNLSYHCKCGDFIKAVEQLICKLNIPKSFKEAGVLETEFIKKEELLVKHSMLGATKVNPVKISEEEMKKLVPLVYYGNQ